MVWQTQFTQAARIDILDAAEWYNQINLNLGADFINRLTQKIDLISQNPAYYAIRFRSVRAAKINRYPYLIYLKFEEENKRIIILGVLHMSRNPKEIKKR